MAFLWVVILFGAMAFGVVYGILRLIEWDEKKREKKDE